MFFKFYKFGSGNHSFDVNFPFFFRTDTIAIKSDICPDHFNDQKVYRIAYR